MAPPPINDQSPVAVESEMDALKFDPAALDEFVDGDAEEGGSTQLALARWRRVATLAAWLARNVPGLDYDTMTIGGKGAPRFLVSGSLDAKLRRWRREDEEAKEAERASRASVWQHDAGDEADSDGEVSDEEEEEDDENDSPALRDLKVSSTAVQFEAISSPFDLVQARRRHLKSVIRQARLATRGVPSSIRRISSSSKQHKKHSAAAAREYLKVFPGYTVLVFDTNILLTSMKLFRELIEAETWTIIVPLAGELIFVAPARRQELTTLHARSHHRVGRLEEERGSTRSCCFGSYRVPRVRHSYPLATPQGSDESWQLSPRPLHSKRVHRLLGVSRRARSRFLARLRPQHGRCYPPSCWMAAGALHQSSRPR